MVMRNKMGPLSLPRRYRFLLLLLGPIGLSGVAMADQLEPVKIRTIPVQFQAGPAETPVAAESLATPHRIRTLTVKPLTPEQAQGAGGFGSSAGIQLARTQPLGPDFQKDGPDSDWHAVQIVPVPAPSVPQELLGT